MNPPPDKSFFIDAIAHAEAGHIFVGDKLRIYPITETTMTIVDDMIRAGHEEGTMVIALDQTGGVGGVDPKTGMRRKWQSRRGNFMASIILSIPPGRPSKQGEIIAEYAMIKTAEDLQLRGIQGKLPNDVLVNGKKICGTVIFPDYALLPRDTERKVNLGIGVNLAVAPDADQATTCFKDHGIDIGVGEFAALFIKHLSAAMREYRDAGFVPILQKMGLANPDTGAITMHPNASGPFIRGYYHDFFVGRSGADPKAEFMQLRLENGQIVSLPTKSYSARTVIKNPAGGGLLLTVGGLHYA